MLEVTEDKNTPKVKAIIGVMFRQQSVCEELFNKINNLGWKAHYQSETYDFNLSTYYENEMGPNLRRVFISLKNLFFQTEIIKIKEGLIELENLSRVNERRTLNLDAGYLDLHRVVLLSNKEGPHKIYLEKGIWADLSLLRKRGAFQNLPWTFPDLREGRYHVFFEKTRDLFKKELREAKFSG